MLYTEQKLTPIEKYNNIFVKRDDLYTIAGVCGGKARTCYAIAKHAKGIITAGSRVSPQVLLASAIAKHLGIPCRVHVPSGNFTPELTATKANGAIIIQHKPGYNSVIIKRAKDDAIANPEYTYIPFGMECWEAIEQTKYQVQNIPKGVKRIVVPVGSAMTLAGILNGLVEYKMNIPVVGIVVGADPVKRLDHYAPIFWRKKCTLINSEDNYHLSRNNVYLDNILLDPIYEAKCLPYIKPGDLFWIVGIRNI